MTKRLLIVAAWLGLATALAGCTPDSPEMKRLKTWKLGDWLHDIDAAGAAIKAAEKGDYGPPSEDLERLIKAGPKTAFSHALGATSRDVPRCFKRKKSIFEPGATTIDHACLDELGYKRSQ